MRVKSFECALFTLVILHNVHAADPIDVEMFSLLERTESANQIERQQSVRQLLALRETISDALVGVVTDANHGKAQSRAKAGSMFLMGELGLVQCK